MKRCLVALGLAASGCGLPGVGEVHAVAVPAPTVLVPVGARHDVLVAACQDELSLQRLLTPVAATALFVGLGRLDAAFYLPEALIRAAVPECEPIDYAVDDARIDGPWRLEATDNPAAFSAVAEAAGVGRFEATVTADGETRTVATAFEARPIDAVQLTPQCSEPGADGDLLPVASGTDLRILETWIGGGAALTGYDIEPVVATEGAVRIERGRGTRLVFDEPGPLALGSPFDPTLRLAFAVFTDADVDTLALAPPEPPLFADTERHLATAITVDGAAPCTRADRPHLVVETPATCGFSGWPAGDPVDARSARLRGLAPGTCVVSASNPASGARARIELPVHAPLRPVLDLPGFERALDMWVRGPDDVFVVGYDSDISGRVDGVFAHVDGERAVVRPRLPRGGSLRAVHGGGGLVVAVGEGVFRFDGLGLERDPDPLFDDAPTLYAVWVAGPDEIVVGGDDGFVARFDGRRWTRIDPGHAERIQALYREPDGAVVISGFGPPVRWRAGVVTPIATPDGGPGGGRIRRIGDELWFLGRITGPISIRGDVALPVPLAVDQPFAVRDVYAADDALYFVYAAGIHRVLGRPAEPDGWLHLYTVTPDGPGHASAGFTLVGGAEDALYAVDGNRLWRRALD